MKAVAFSGWTQPHDALDIIVPQAHHYDYSDYDSITSVSNSWSYDADIVIGWSLGGMIAKRLIINKKLNPQYLVLIATPYQFVANEPFKAAMPPDTFAQFYANYRDDSQRTAKRFHGLLAKGDQHAKRLLGEYEHHPTVHDTERWLPWMDWLETYKAADHNYSEFPPTLIIHGENDAIVPFAQGKAMCQLITHSELVPFEKCGHTPHMHDRMRVQKLITEFTGR